MNISETQFWDWFAKNNLKFYRLDNIEKDERETLLTDFLNQLHKYSNGLFFQIGGESDDKRELIISAEGDAEYFNKVQNLVMHAPKFANWEVIAFKPPMGIDFIIDYEDLKIDPRNIWFLPLENENNSKVIGLRICFANFDPHKQKQFLAAAYQILDTILGEKSNALDVHYLEVGELPTNPEENGLIELEELPEYINWKKAKNS